MKKLFAYTIALVTAATVFHFIPIGASAKADKFHRSTRPVPNRYIVVLDETVSDFRSGSAAAVGELNSQFPGLVKQLYSNAINGYSVEMTEDMALQLSEDPRVKYVEEDGWIEPQASQADATWGIARIDQPEYRYPIDTTYNYTS